MRKLFAAVLALTFVVGGLFAEEFKGALFVKFDKDTNKATFKIDDKEKEFIIAKDAKKVKGRDGEVELTEALGKAKADAKYDLTTNDKGEITEAKRGRGKKQN
jgi:hypothetical protein